VYACLVRPPLAERLLQPDYREVHRRPTQQHRFPTVGFPTPIRRKLTWLRPQG